MEVEMLGSSVLYLLQWLVEEGELMVMAMEMVTVVEYSDRLRGILALNVNMRKTAMKRMMVMMTSAQRTSLSHKVMMNIALLMVRST